MLVQYRRIQKRTTDSHFLKANSSNYRYRSALPEELIAVAETDLWERWQKISHHIYRFSLEFQLISITDTDFGLESKP